jgi:hypothetical protein
LKQLFAVFLVVCIGVFSPSTLADQHVHGYTRSNGTYVQPYYRSSPNNTVRDNFSYQGNVNPYTGAVGTNRYIHDRTSPYYQGPDRHGRVGHGAAGEPKSYRVPNSVSLCPSPHFIMTEQDGCQAVR